MLFHEGKQGAHDLHQHRGQIRGRILGVVDLGAQETLADPRAAGDRFRRHPDINAELRDVRFPDMFVQVVLGQPPREAEHYLDKHVWESDVAQFGIDIWMTTEAIASGARVCQSFLGAKIHNPKDPAADLAAMLVQVMGALFALMEEHQEVWGKLNGSNPVKLYGFQYEVGVEPVNVNVERMVGNFRQGLADLE